MEAAFRQVNIWKNAGRDLMVSVNISAKYLDDFAIPEQLLSLATQFDIQPNRIYLEITESSLLDRTKLSMEVLTRLRIKNFNLSIDDFGTGYSSMLSLHQMPFSQIKIDKSFILKIENDPGLQTIARNLIKLFKELKIETVAEGIETKAALDLLYGYSCDIGQGYHISRPLSVEHFDNWAKTYSPSI
jgi:EAL domain-containing protein (putative c-di-GMP-specific phosphodiesterase class I)